MQKRKPQRPVSAHRKARNASRRACCTSPVTGFDSGHELLKEKLLVSLLSIMRVDVEASARSGRNDHELAQPMLFPQIFDQIPAARMQKHLLVVAKPVKKIKHRITPRLLHVVTGRQQGAVSDRTRKNLALDALAFRAPGCGSPHRLARKCANHKNKAGQRK